MNCVRLCRATVTTNRIQRASSLWIRTFSAGGVVDPPEDPLITIPRSKTRENEAIEQQKSRLVYQSRKRGMLENDLLLSTFAAKYLKELNPQQTNDYDKLINGPSNDWDIYYWATNVKPTPKEFDNDIMSLLKEHCKNLNKESRIRQPDL